MISPMDSSSIAMTVAIVVLICMGLMNRFGEGDGEEVIKV